MQVGPSSPLVSPSPMAQLLEQLALDNLPPNTPSKESLDSLSKTLTEEPESFRLSPTRVEFPSLLTNSRDSSLTVESAASSGRPSREGSCIIPAGPVRNASSTSLHKSVETVPPVPQYDPIIKNYPHPLHTSTSSPALRIRTGTSILRTSSFTDQSASASSNPSSPPTPPNAGTPTIKFAPLPEIERPKKRRHNHALGVAARSQMLARRRQMMRDDDDPDRPPRHLWRSEEEDDGEDPLIALGHMVKLASIGIWRKVSLKDKKARSNTQTRSSSDSVLEISSPATYADDEDGNNVVFDEPAEGISDDELPPPPAETTMKTAEDEVVVQTQAVPTVPTPTEES